MSTDTRHPQYDDTTLQAAIDVACESTTIPSSHQTLDLRSSYSSWKEEAPARLALARGLLARLIAAARDQGEAVDWKARYEEAEKSRHEWIRKWEMAADEIGRLQTRSEKAEAELANWHSELSAVMPADFKDWHQNSKAEWPLVARQVIENLRERERLAWENALPQLRPIAKAGPVPEGCVRYHFKKHDNGVWSVGTLAETHGDTHCADIRLPSPAASQDSQPAEAVLREELGLATAWPAVGDTVRLKSGGPVMTITDVDDLHKNIITAWFDGFDAVTMGWPAACLKSSTKEEQP